MLIDVQLIFQESVKAKNLIVLIHDLNSHQFVCLIERRASFRGSNKRIDTCLQSRSGNNIARCVSLRKTNDASRTIKDGTRVNRVVESVLIAAALCPVHLYRSLTRCVRSHIGETGTINDATKTILVRLRFQRCWQRNKNTPEPLLKTITSLLISDSTIAGNG